MLRGIVLCALLCALTNGFEKESRIVRTTQGAVKGYKEDGIYQFHSIPYASAPTGRNKFKAPYPGPVWTDTFEAVPKGIICPQAVMTGMNIQEDCLVASVYVPDTQETNLPVLVIVHGGAYQVGTGSMLTPIGLVNSKKIIAVSFNYRLGAHGFLCLGTEDAPGNAGMKDQVALLRWVQQNIRAFGGNPNDVTIDGFSAGSSAVDLLQLSKTTKGLFNKVIPESGANLAVWSVQMDPLKQAKEYAQTLNFNKVDDLYALEEFYKTTSLEILQTETFVNRYNSTFGFTPCLERDTGVEMFLDDSPLNILRSGNYEKRPMLYGFAEKEGMFRISYSSFDTWKDGMNKKFSDFLPADLKFESEVEKEEVAQKVKEFYFGDKPVAKDTVYAYIDYFTDVIFAYSTLRSVRLQVEAGNNQIYLYEYSFVAVEPAPMPNPTIEKLKVKGANHCDQSFAVYEPSWFGVKDESGFSARTKKMRAKMRELWLNFITESSPVPKGSPFPAWPAADATGSPHMSLDEKLELRGPLLEERTRFWDDIYAKHYRNPIPPPAPPSKRTEL